MNIPAIISILLSSLCVLNAHSQDGASSPRKFYDYNIEMPNFMADHLEFGSCSPGFFWGWRSRDGKISVSHAVVRQPAIVLASVGDLNKALKDNAPLEMAPEFIDLGQNRFLHESKSKNIREIVIAEEMPNNECGIAVFWVYGENSERKAAILRVLRSGRFGERNPFMNALIKKSIKRHNELELAKGGRLVIELEEGGEIIHQGKEITVAGLEKICRDWVDKMNEEPYKNIVKPRLHLRADKRCKTESIKAAVGAAAKGGMTDVIFGALVRN